LRIYHKDEWDEGTPLKLEDLHRCKNLQEFYSSEFVVDFKFADKLKNLRVVDLYTNNSDNKRGLVKFIFHEERKIKNLNYLKSCLVLNLEDSFVDDFTNIQDNVLTLSVKNSNFEDLEALSKLNNLQYLDISQNQIKSLDGIHNFKDLRVLNCCKIEFVGSEKSKLVFFSLLNELKNLELLVLDSKLHEEYKACINILPPEKLVIVHKSYSTNVNLTTFEIINHFKIAEQLNKKVTLSEIDFEPIKGIFIKKSK